MKARFKGHELTVKVLRYAHNDNLALLLQSATGEPYGKATANVEFQLPDPLVVVKDYSENEGMLDALVEAGVVQPLSYKTPLGHAEGLVCWLNMPDIPARKQPRTPDQLAKQRAILQKFSASAVINFDEWLNRLAVDGNGS